MSIRAHSFVALLLVAFAVAKTGVFLFIVYVCFVDLGRAPVTEADIARTRWMLQMAGIVGTGALICTAGAALVAFRIRVLRIREFGRSLRDFEASDFRDRVPSSGQTLAGQDIDLLRQHFAAMTERVVGRIHQLNLAEEHLRELVADMSHDLKTPLALLQGYLDTLLNNGANVSHDDQREYLRIASHHAERLQTLVSELFELAELESPEASVELQPLALHELAEDVCSSFQLRAAEKNVTVRCDSEPDLPPVLADGRLIELVFENLIENAVRFSSVTGGEVVVDLRRDGGFLAVTVRDHGKGISPTDLPLVFDRSFRSKDSRQHDGSGLGLAIVKRILQLHGVAIEVESTVGKGTVFSFKLPIAPS